MFSWLARLTLACWGPLARRYVPMSKDDDNSRSGANDALIWCRDLEKHSFGEFSFAVVQANEIIEDHSQVETGRDATFVGVYDGHGGPDASRFICDHLFLHLMSELCWSFHYFTCSFLALFICSLQLFVVTEKNQFVFEREISGYFFTC